MMRRAGLLRRDLALSLGLLMAGATLAAAEPQAEKANWDNLKQLRAGERIEVVETNLKLTRGTFLAVSEEAITLQTKKGEMAVPRAEVLRVSAHGGGRTKNALAGALVGGLAGLALGAAGDYASDSSANGGKLFCTPVGAAIGAGIGSAFPGYHTIYRAKNPQRDAKP